jgi:hypothetical protein
MSCEQFRTRLEELEDGLLDPVQAAAVTAHVAGCEPCRRELAGLHELARRTRGLDRSIEPPRDLWSEIADAIGRRRVAAGRFGGGRRAAVWAAAAAAVVAVAVVVGYLAGRQGSSPTPPAPGQAGRVLRASLALDEVDAAEEEFLRAREQLMAALAGRRDTLSPGTLEVVESNLRLIDQAIEEIAAALAEDPGNSALAHRLTAAYRRQIEFLQRATRLPAET